MASGGVRQEISAAQLAAVEQALSAFYTQPEPTRSQAHAWLMALQRSPQAWEISLALLQPQTKMEMQMFAASTLQAKIQANWNEIPAESRTGLLQTVLGHITQRAAGSARPLITRLCVCVVLIAFHMLPGGGWPTYVNDIFAMVTQGGRTMVPIAVQLLSISAEELGRPHLLKEQKESMIKALNSNIPTVLALLQSLMAPEQQDERIKTEALKCFLSWLSCDSLVIPIKDVLDSPILAHTFEALKSEELFLLAVEVLGEVITIRGLEKYPVALSAIAQKVLELRADYKKALEEEDEEIAKGICQVMIRLGETFTRQIFANDDIGKCYIEFALACTAHESREVSQVTLNFWFEFEEYLASDGKPKRDLYVPAFRHLLPLLIKASRIPRDWHELPKDIRDEFQEFRVEVKDTLLYTQTLLEAETLAIMATLMQQQMASLQAPADESALQEAHLGIEALLFGMSSLTEGLDMAESTLLPQILGRLLFMLPTTPLVAASAIRLIGDLSEWLNEHPTSLEPAVRYLLSTIASPALRSSAVSALRQVAEQCGQHLQPVLEHILASYENLSSSLNDKERCLMIETLTFIIASSPPHTALQALQRIIPPVVQKLSSLLSTSGESQQKNMALCAELNTVVGVCRCLDTAAHFEKPEDHPLALVLKAVWPHIDFALKNHSSAEILKACCQVLKHSLLSMKEAFYPFLPAFTALIVENFERHRHPYFLSLLAATANIFTNPSHDQARTLLSASITAIAASFFKAAQQDITKMDPDLLDAFYKDLMLQFHRFNPQVVRVDIVDTVYHSAIAALLVFKERRVLQALHALLRELTGEDRNDQSVAVRDALLRKHGKYLLHTIFTCLSGHTSRSEFGPLSRLLIAFVNAQPSWAREWVSELFAVQNFPSPIITPEKKRKFLNDMMAIKNRERFERVVSEFALQCRGLTEVGGTF